MFSKHLIVIGAIITMAQLTLQASTAYDPYYSAGVVEFRPSISLTPAARLQDNLQAYLNILNSTDAKDLDIIAFPESTLNNNDEATFVPNPEKQQIAPCDDNSGDYHTFLQQISCAARRLGIYVVINLTEKEWCSTVPEDTRKCASTGLNIFNTNVVFNRQGVVISRYRKVNLYGENKNTTFVPEQGWFDTDFGVRFGHFICFDILFYSPAQVLVESIKDFIFPSMWFSQLPFLTAVQVHQAWSYSNNVNLLAAGSSNPLVGSSGTGIYNGRKGIIKAVMNHGNGVRQLYTAQVPKYRHLTKRSLTATPKAIKAKLTMPDMYLKRDYLESYQTYVVDLLNFTSLKHEMCYVNSTLCCKFELKWQALQLTGNTRYYQYRLGVYDGLRNEQAAETNELKNCAVFSCIGPNIADCGKQFTPDVDVVFENITITTTMPQAEQYLIMPNSLKADLMPLPVNQFKWQESLTKNNVQIRYELNTTTPNVMAFAIYGNYYDSEVQVKPDDEKDGNGDGASSLTLNLFLLVLGIFLMQYSNHH